MSRSARYWESQYEVGGSSRGDGRGLGRSSSIRDAFVVHKGSERNLREMFKIDAADYMMSICGDDGLRELSSPGKSGSIFYLSHDERFVIKTLRRSELKVRFVVMGNMFCTELRIHRRYDLKGSSQGRSTEKCKIDENTTLKDLDLSYVFHMDKSLRESLFK
ncbi:hypothetical protein HHK36_030416 [Tetracentron sinense]|uniref:1-phosphatidylinositol-4-phosphate 5-kinase n=1 Tax=Tetracentron sinense TaxID=13715 RepID=A0A834Y9K1_TETSI|nr:hypothetical protein HHK36_030416 [Tetracentron sinense]